MLTRRTAGMLLATLSAGYGQSSGKKSETRKFGNDRDEATIRALLAEGFETSWNNHHPAVADTADKVIDDAIFITVILPEAG